MVNTWSTYLHGVKLDQYLRDSGVSEASCKHIDCRPDAEDFGWIEFPMISPKGRSAGCLELLYMVHD